MSAMTNPSSSNRTESTGTRIWILAALLVLVLGGVWLWLNRVPADQLPANRPPRPVVNHPAPDFSLSTLDGGQFTLSELRGAPVVLNFWATWCGPCQKELPALQAASERHAGRVQFVGVDQAEPQETVQKYADEMGLTFTIPLDLQQDVADLYDVLGLPITFFIDAEGIIRHMWIGEMNTITLEEGIAKISP